MPQTHPPRAVLRAVLAALVLCPASAGATVTGVCPDGSMFIVQREADIPCRNAKQVAPNEMPPIRPQLLPRPYGWQVFQERQDPNNPYNLIDAARDVRAAPAPPREGGGATPPGPAPSRATPPQPEAAPTPAVSAAPPQVALSDQERQDLALLVELTQQRAPATFRGDGEGGGGLVVRLAHSRAFEARVHQLQRDRGEAADGAVVLFAAEAQAPTSFHPNFTFAQGHLATHPDPEDPHQLGVIAGHLGRLGAGQKVLGYVVLPSGIDLGQPLDVYWNDRRLAATLER